MKSQTLKEKIEATPEDSILFRSDFPEYHSEFVGSVLSDLTNQGMLYKIAQGIYTKPRKSKFGPVFPSVDKIVKAIAIRDNAEVLPTGTTALNELGLSTQIPMKYTYLTTGSQRTIQLSQQQIILKHSAPRNFCYKTNLIALLVQALRSLKQENIKQEELQIIQNLLIKENNRENLTRDVDIMPSWMKRIIKPLLKF